MTQVSKQETPFRIGGLYRQQNGTVVRLSAITFESHREKWEGLFPGHKFAGADSALDGHGCGYVSLVHGGYVAAMEAGSPDSGQSLVPGELHEVDGQWVARGVEEEKVTAFIDGVFYQFGADTVEVFTQDYLPDPNAAMIARDGPQQDSYCVCRNHTSPGIVHRSDGPCYVAEVVTRTAKPNPFASFRNPDSCNGPADHLNAARHQMAGMKG